MKFKDLFVLFYKVPFECSNWHCSDGKSTECDSRSILGASPTNVCIYVYKYMDQNGSAAMLAVKRSSVTP